MRCPCGYLTTAPIRTCLRVCGSFVYFVVNWSLGFPMPLQRKLSDSAFEHSCPETSDDSGDETDALSVFSDSMESMISEAFSG